MQLTVFETDDQRLSCLYSWDISHIDIQGVDRVHKLDVHKDIIDKLMSCTFDRIEVLLAEIIK